MSVELQITPFWSAGWKKEAGWSLSSLLYTLSKKKAKVDLIVSRCDAHGERTTHRFPGGERYRVSDIEDKMGLSGLMRNATVDTQLTETIYWTKAGVQQNLKGQSALRMNKRLFNVCVSADISVQLFFIDSEEGVFPDYNPVGLEPETEQVATPLPAEALKPGVALKPKHPLYQFGVKRLTLRTADKLDILLQDEGESQTNKLVNFYQSLEGDETHIFHALALALIMTEADKGFSEIREIKLQAQSEGVVNAIIQRVEELINTNDLGGTLMLSTCPHSIYYNGVNVRFSKVYGDEYIKLEKVYLISDEDAPPTVSDIRINREFERLEPEETEHELVESELDQFPDAWDTKPERSWLAKLGNWLLGGGWR